GRAAARAADVAVAGALVAAAVRVRRAARAAVQAMVLRPVVLHLAMARAERLRLGPVILAIVQPVGLAAGEAALPGRPAVEPARGRARAGIGRAAAIVRARVGDEAAVGAVALALGLVVLAVVEPVVEPGPEAELPRLPAIEAAVLCMGARIGR